MQLCGFNVEIINDSISTKDLQVILDSYDHEDGRFRFLNPIGSGSYGYVFSYKNYAIKHIVDPNNPKSNDIEVLKALQHLDCIPKLYAVADNSIIIMEKINGVTVREFCYEDNTNGIELDDSFLEKWDQALLDVVKSGYSPDDLHESNVMIDFETITPKLVDVGWFFKHNRDYSIYGDSDIHMMRSDYGYSRAEMWTGDEIRGYLRRKQREKDAEKQKLLAC